MTDIKAQRSKILAERKSDPRPPKYSWDTWPQGCMERREWDLREAKRQRNLKSLRNAKAKATP